MQLTLHTDYALRTLIYLAEKGDEQATISEIAEFYQISRNHLVKVVHHLSKAAFIHTTRGKHGGMVLARAPELISISDVIQKMEPNFDIVECFNSSNPSCAISPICSLKTALYEASKAFLAELDNYTLANAINYSNPHEQIFPAEWLVRARPAKD